MPSNYASVATKFDAESRIFLAVLLVCVTLKALLLGCRVYMEFIPIEPAIDFCSEVSVYDVRTSIMDNMDRVRTHPGKLGKYWKLIN